jgi:alkyl hydroperoxide reductase subunit AhpF
VIVVASAIAGGLEKVSGLLTNVLMAERAIRYAIGGIFIVTRLVSHLNRILRDPVERKRAGSYATDQRGNIVRHGLVQAEILQAECSSRAGYQML